jgi:hypothetical protein
MELVLWVRDLEQVASKENVEQVVEIIALIVGEGKDVETLIVTALEA